MALLNSINMFGLFKKKEKENYKFNDPEETPCFSCVHVVNKERPVLFVAHDADGSWQFLCGEDDTIENAKIISLKNATLIDTSINDLFEMPLGVGAERTSINDTWKPFKLPAV